MEAGGFVTGEDWLTLDTTLEVLLTELLELELLSTSSRDLEVVT